MLTHELGHRTGGTNRLAGVAYRGREALARICSTLDGASSVGRVVTDFARTYARFTEPLNRRQEEAADIAAALMTSPQVTASALLELQRIAVAWDYYLSAFVPPRDGCGIAPGRPGGGIRLL